MVVSNTDDMVRQMSPRLVAGLWRFETVSEDGFANLLPSAQAVFREDEGVSMILPADEETQLAMCQITLDVNSSLEGTGLTAAVSTALAAAGIACNMVAAHHHDHVFVPANRVDDAMKILNSTSDSR